MRMGIIAERRRKRRAARWRKGVLAIAGSIGVLTLLVIRQPIWESVHGFVRDTQAFSQSAQIEMTLPAYDVYALQLAVFDSGERAASELKRLQEQGVRCVIWQREKMRIIADAALSREALDMDAAKGREAYVISDALEEVSLRLSADAVGAAQARELLETPDRILRQLAQRETPVDAIVSQTKALAEAALDAHPENALYTQLAQSLLGWSSLMEKTIKDAGESETASYGAATMGLLCRELRQALIASSTASAQRTPSTAADVMPPA